MLLLDPTPVTTASTFITALPILLMYGLPTLTAIFATIRAWTIISNKVKTLEEELVDITNQLEERDVADSSTLELVHKISIILTGADGTNGVNGRTKENEKRIGQLERELSELRGQVGVNRRDWDIHRKMDNE